MKNKNEKVLADFIKFCLNHPELRFWQALRSWAKVGFILTSTHFDAEMFDKDWLRAMKVKIYDTYYWTGKNK